MIDVQKIIEEIIWYRVRRSIGACMVFIGFICIAGCETTIKYTNDSCWIQIVIGIVLLVHGSYLSEMFHYTYEIKHWKSQYCGAVSYSFKQHSWIKACSYKNDLYWSYVLCDINGTPKSRPIWTHKSFSDFKWYSV